jgi:hypothetical protein
MKKFSSWYLFPDPFNIGLISRGITLADVLLYIRRINDVHAVLYVLHSNLCINQAYFTHSLTNKKFHFIKRMLHFIISTIMKPYINDQFIDSNDELGYMHDELVFGIAPNVNLYDELVFGIAPNVNPFDELVFGFTPNANPCDEYANSYDESVFGVAPNVNPFDDLAFGATPKTDSMIMLAYMNVMSAKCVVVLGDSIYMLIKMHVEIGETKHVIRKLSILLMETIQNITNRSYKCLRLNRITGILYNNILN